MDEPNGVFMECMNFYDNHCNIKALIGVLMSRQISSQTRIAKYLWQN